jgi:hypothetical protein
MKEAQQTLESGGARFTWLDAPIDIADEALANAKDQPDAELAQPKQST